MLFKSGLIQKSEIRIGRCGKFHPILFGKSAQLLGHHTAAFQVDLDKSVCLCFTISLCYHHHHHHHHQYHQLISYVANFRIAMINYHRLTCTLDGLMLASS